MWRRLFHAMLLLLLLSAVFLIRSLSLAAVERIKATYKVAANDRSLCGSLAGRAANLFIGSQAVEAKPLALTDSSFRFLFMSKGFSCSGFMHTIALYGATCMLALIAQSEQSKEVVNVFVA